MYRDLDDYSKLMRHIIKYDLKADVELGKWIKSRFTPLSVVDLGCGPGAYLLPFKRDPECEVLGLDAEPSAGSLLRENEFNLIDLRHPYTPDRRFDVALCIEVAEHLRSEFAFQLVENICRCSDVVLFSAAPPNQGGDFHHNEQPPEYWEGLFRPHGYHIDRESTQILLEHLYENKVYDVVPWLRGNMRIYKKWSNISEGSTNRCQMT